MQIDFIQQPVNIQEDEALKNTKAVIAALKKKVKAHNAEGKEKVTYAELKNVFLIGVEEEKSGVGIVTCGFARINMFLRLLEGKSLAHEFKESSLGILRGGKGHLDFTGYISPKEIDFIKATEDVKEYQIGFNLKSIEDLYFTEKASGLSLTEYL